MICETEKNGSKLIIRMSGEISASDITETEKPLLEEVEGITNLTVDLDGLEYISSSGLRVLIRMQKRMNKQGNMVIKNVADEIMEVFKITGYAKYFNIVSD